MFWHQQSISYHMTKDSTLYSSSFSSNHI